MNVQNIVDRDKCCGCELCSAICLHKSVKFEKDEEGFVYPVVEEDTCMKCSACINHCPVQSIDKDICKTINIMRHMLRTQRYFTVVHLEELPVY